MVKNTDGSISLKGHVFRHDKISATLWKFRLARQEESIEWVCIRPGCGAKIGFSTKQPAEPHTEGEMPHACVTPEGDMPLHAGMYLDICPICRVCNTPTDEHPGDQPCRPRPVVLPESTP